MHSEIMLYAQLYFHDFLHSPQFRSVRVCGCSVHLSVFATPISAAILDSTFQTGRNISASMTSLDRSAEDRFCRLQGCLRCIRRGFRAGFRPIVRASSSSRSRVGPKLPNPIDSFAKPRMSAACEIVTFVPVAMPTSWY
jgi:hypothetical protein